MNPGHFPGANGVPLTVALLFVLILAPLGHIFSSQPARGSQSSVDKKSKSSGAVKSVVNDVPMPFRIGEKLNYYVAWAAFPTAASVQLSVPERRDLFGGGTWHFRASAHTLSPVRSLFTIDDQFDSYTDASTLESRQFEMHLDEMGRKKDEVLNFAYEGQPARAPGPKVFVLPGTRDPLGALYALRGVDWQHTTEFRAPVFDGRDVYEMLARLEAPSDKVTVAAGDYSATRLSIHLFQHGKEVSGTNFSAWLAHDAARTPVLMQAELSFGTLRVELTSAPQ
jgi:Protein of unknown function (DUF3108)